MAGRPVDLREHRSGQTGREMAAGDGDDQAPAAPAPRRRLSDRISTAWQRIAATATTLDAAIGIVRSLIVSVVVIVGVVFAFGVIVDELRHKMIVLEPIHLPERLLDLGYTPQMMARELKAQIGAIRDESTTLKELKALQGEWEQLDIQIPETETTLRQVLNYLRVLFDREEIRIGGAIVGADDLGYSLRLWSDDGGLGTVEIDRERVGEPVLKQGMPVLVADGAEAIMAHAEPYVLALAWFTRELRGATETAGAAAGDEPEASPAQTRIERLLAARLEGGGDDVPWIYNQFGLLRHRAGRLAAAIAAYDQAIAAKADFAIAHYNRGLAHAARGDFAAAAADYEQALAGAADSRLEARDRFGIGVRHACARYQLARADPTEANKALYRSVRDALQQHEGPVVPEHWVSSFFAQANANCATDALERTLAGLAQDDAR